MATQNQSQAAGDQTQAYTEDPDKVRSDIARSLRIIAEVMQNLAPIIEFTAGYITGTTMRKRGEMKDQDEGRG